MDDSIWALIIALIFSTFIFAVEFYIFSVYRQYRSKPIFLDFEVDEEVDLKVPVFSESSTPLWTLLQHVWAVPYSEIADYCGLEAQLLLAFHLVTGKSLAVMAFLGVCVLIPFYSLGNNEVNNEMSSLSIAHIIEQENLVLAPFIFIVIFTVISILTIFNYIKEISDAESGRTEHSFTIDKQTIEIRGIQVKINPSNASIDVFAEINSEFSGIEAVYVVPDLSEAYKTKLELDENKKQLQRYSEFTKTHEEKLLIRKGCKKVDAIEYYTKETMRLEKLMKEEIEERKGLSAGKAYVLCESPAAAYRILEKFKGKPNQENSEKWELKLAPAPSEILWENFGEGSTKRTVTRILLWIIFIIVFFLLATPTTFIQFATYILDFFGLNSLTQGLLGQFFPSLILILYEGFIVRHAVLAIVKRECLESKSEEIISGLYKYLWVMVTYSFIVPLLGVQLIFLLKEGIEEELESMQDYFTSNATFAGSFFTIYIIGMVFLKNGSDLMQLPKLVRVKIRQSQALSEKEKILAYEAYEFRWAYEYGTSITGYFITLAFSVAYPIILIPGSIFFYTRYITIKYNLLCFYCVDHTTPGIKISEMVISSYIVAIFMFQIMSCGLILLNPYPIFIVLCSVFLIISLVVFVCISVNKKKLENKIKEEFRERTENEEETVLKPNIEQYFHPMHEYTDYKPAIAPNK